MKLKLPLLTVLLASAFAAFQVFSPLKAPSQDQIASKTSAGTTDASAVAADGDTVVAQSISTLRRLNSFRVSLRILTELFGQQLRGKGEYAQQPQQGERPLKHSFEIVFSAGDHIAKMTQISNGRDLYRKTEGLDEERTVEKIDLNQIRSELASQGISNGRLATSFFGVGDLSFSMEQLRKHFEFGSPHVGTIGSDSVLVVRGHWRRKSLNQILGIDLGDESTPLSREELGDLPPHFPHSVELTLWRDPKIQFFPYRIVFSKFADERELAKERAIVAIEFFDLASIDAKPEYFEFDAQEDDRRSEDVTHRYLDQLSR